MNHVPHGLQSLVDQGALPGNRELSVTIALSLNHQDDLNRELHDLYDPSSASYHHFLTPDEFRARYAPTQEQVAAVESFLQSRGLHDFSLNANGYLLRTRGSVGSLGNAFSTEVHQYRHTSGALYYAPSIEPMMPAGLPVSAVVGLDNLTHVSSHIRGIGSPRFQDLPSLAASPRTTCIVAGEQGTGPLCGLSPSDISTAYSVPSSVDGSGQTIALAEFDGYSSSDITTYESYFGISGVTIQNIMVDGATGKDCGSGAEDTLDIELVTAIAPGASKILVYEAPNDESSIIDLYSQIANDDTANQVSSSWGSAEASGFSSFYNEENTIFEQMSTQGQSMYASSGDWGADDNGYSLSVDDPASQPYVVGVGGTTLTLSGFGGSYSSETSWDEATDSAGGGGISTVWSIPSWQSGNLGTSGGSTTMRNVPDVSLDADPYQSGYAIYYSGGWSVYGGTSAASPLWAGFNALVNQQRIANSKTVLGFPNTAIYSLASGASYSSDFNDVTTGNNLYYDAVTGYDLSTGWGSFKGSGLFSGLSTY